MIAVAGSVARNVWASDEPPPPAAPDEEGEEGDTDSASSTSEPADKAAGQPATTSLDRAAKESPSALARPPVINHAGQAGISIMPGTGYRVVVPYGDIRCGDSSSNVSKHVCTHILPVFLDLQLSYGAFPRLDFIVDLRFAVQKDPATADSHQFALAPGVRYWLDQGVALKLYATGQAVYDHTDYIQVSKSDFALRNADGLMYDAIKNVGFFFQVGWTMGFLRWYRLEFDAGIGMQVRFQ
jgi:hypothetical protein